MQVHEFLERSAERFPDRKAAWYKDEWKTFAELDAMANQVGNHLKERGVRRGDRVALLYENSFDYIAAYYGILKAGAVTVALNTETTSDALRYLLTNSGARAVVTRGGEGGGWVRAEGEIWQATWSGRLDPGTPVRVASVDHLTLFVEPAGLPPASPAESLPSATAYRTAARGNSFTTRTDLSRSWIRSSSTCCRWA